MVRKAPQPRISNETMDMIVQGLWHNDYTGWTFKRNTLLDDWTFYELPIYYRDVSVKIHSLPRDRVRVQIDDKDVIAELFLFFRQMRRYKDLSFRINSDVFLTLYTNEANEKNLNCIDFDYIT